jgi:hypothetical protein
MPTVLVDQAPVISLEYHNTRQAAREPRGMLPEAIALLDILPQLAVYENGTKMKPDKILKSLRPDVQTAFLHITTALLALVHRSLQAAMHTMQHP